MDGAVDGEATRIDAEIRRIVEDVAVVVDLHQVRGLDLVEHQAIGVDQEPVLFTGSAGRDVGVDKVGPAEMRDQPVAGGEINAHLPFGAETRFFTGPEARGLFNHVGHGSS